MNICLIGYGRMGHEIERVATGRGHSIVGKLEAGWQELPACDVAIEFTEPGEALHNIARAIAQGVPVVSGTTGWLQDWDSVVKEVEKHAGALFYASNFSIGVYLFRIINKKLAGLMNSYPNYQPTVEEIHHIHKLDYPSGTAITLANDIIEELANKWESKAYLEPSKAPNVGAGQLLIRSVRTGEEPGTHIIRYESDEDLIEIKHVAKGRAGLALGAVLASEFLVGKRGVFGMRDLVGIE